MSRRVRDDANSSRSPFSAALEPGTGGSGRSSAAITVRVAIADDLPWIKALVDSHRHQLGFVPIPALRQAIDHEWLYVAEAATAVVGMIDWWARRDGIVVLYHIVVAPEARGNGAGGLLMDTMIQWARARSAVAVQVKCPLDLPANDFYRHYSFTLIGQEHGKHRPLNHWYLPLSAAGSNEGWQH